MSLNTPVSQQSYSAANNTDEIDLFELFQSIWQEKTLLVIITADTAVLALIYALTSTLVYQVQRIVGPAAIKDLDELNGTGVYKLSSAEAMLQIGTSLESSETRLGYFKANQGLFETLLSPNKNLEQNFERLNRQNIKILKPAAKKDDELSKYVGIQLQYPQGMDGAAIAIAKVLGIATLSSLAKETRTSGNVIRIEVNTQQNPLYLMGIQALNADSDVLLARESDDFTSGRIVDINTALKLLEHNRQIENELGWLPEETFESGIRKTVHWYLDNQQWYQNVQGGSYQRERLGVTL